MSLKQLKQRLNAKLRKRDDIVRVILFGSFARGTATRHSDIDLVIIMRTHRRFLDRYKDIHKAILEALRPYPVEFIIYTPEEFEIMVKNGNHFVKTVLREGKFLL
jgi:predicted nucleotidyltransferase